MAIRESVLKNAEGAIDSILTLVDSVGEISPRDYMKALESAAPEATILARKFLAANYKRAGVKTRSGDLLNGIKASIIEFQSARGGKVSARASMPTGKDKKFYKAANSVNYGRLNSKEFDVSRERTQRGIGGGLETVNVRKVGAKRREKLKRKVQGGSKGRLVVAGQGLAYDASKATKTNAGSTVVNTTMGSATVTKAFNFFTFTPQQEAKLRRVLIWGATEYLNEKLGRKIKGKG